MPINPKTIEQWFSCVTLPEGDEASTVIPPCVHPVCVSLSMTDEQSIKQSCTETGSHAYINNVHTSTSSYLVGISLGKKSLQYIY